MGNDIGKSSNRMAISAMSHVTHMEKREIAALQRKLGELSQRQGNPAFVSREEMNEALEYVGISESDKEILDRLFTMFDKTGDNQVNHREFVVGICPLISGDVQEKIGFAFQMFDSTESGEVRPVDLLNVLSPMNNVASYFGDPVMSHEQIETLVDEIFKSAEVSSKGTIRYTDYTHAIADHPITVAFVSGQGQVRYGSR